MSEELGKLADIHYGKSPAPVLWADGEVPVYGTGGIYGKARSAMFPGPAIVVPRKGSLGNPSYVATSFWPSDTTYAVVPRSGVNAKWLYYNLDRFDLTRLNEATGVPSISRDWLARIRFEKATPEAQRRIATILTTLDEEIEATEALIAKHQQIKAGLMHDLFTRGLWTQAELARGDHKGLPCEATAQPGHLRPTPEEAPGVYQDSPLGIIPKAWSYAAIADLGKVKGGKRLPAGTPFSETPTPYPYLRVTDMVDGWIDDTALAFVPDHIEPLIASYKIFKDDLYVTIAGTLGQFGRIPTHLDGAQLTENAARITEIDRQRVCLDFVCAFLRSDLMAPQKFKAYGLGAGVPKLALYQIEKFIVPLPPIDEQKAAEAVLAANRTKISSETTHLAKLRQQKQGLMHDLLTGRVRVDRNTSKIFA